MTLAVRRLAVVALALSSLSCSIDAPAVFGAPCTRDHDCGGGFTCVNAACVPAAAGEGEGAAGEGEGTAGEGEAGEGEGEGGTRDDGCATSCPCSTVCVNGECTLADELGACSTPNTCACGGSCDLASASCSNGPAPAIRAVLTWQADPNTFDDGPDLDLVATKADGAGRFCITGVPGASCDAFTPGPRAQDCADDSLECYFGDCSLAGDTTSGFTWAHPVWNEVNARGNPVLIGSFDVHAPEVIAIEDLPDDGDYLFGVSFCTQSTSGTSSAPFQVSLTIRGETTASSFEGVVGEGEYRDIAIVHVSSANGLSISPP